MPKDLALAEKATQNRFALHEAIGLNIMAFGLCDLRAVVRSFAVCAAQDDNAMSALHPCVLRRIRDIRRRSHAHDFTSLEGFCRSHALQRRVAPGESWRSRRFGRTEWGGQVDALFPHSRRSVSG